MIILDTHIWIWWSGSRELLTPDQLNCLQENEQDGLGICSISLWEVAKLVEKGRLSLDRPLESWFEVALNYPGMRVIPLSPSIAIESTRLPGEFHKDPMDQIIVATARIHDCLLLTSDQKILQYPHVKTVL